MNLIIDPMCSENICSGSKNVTERNFSNKTNDNYWLIFYESQVLVGDI